MQSFHATLCISKLPEVLRPATLKKKRWGLKQWATTSTSRSLSDLALAGFQCKNIYQEPSKKPKKNGKDYGVKHHFYGNLSLKTNRWEPIANASLRIKKGHVCICISASAIVKPCVAIDGRLVCDWDKHLLYITIERGEINIICFHGTQDNYAIFQPYTVFGSA